MSTKIHHGLILRKATLAQGLDRLKGVLTAVLPKARAAVAKAIAQHMTEVRGKPRIFSAGRIARAA